MKILCSRQTFIKQMNERTKKQRLAFLEFLSEPKSNSNFDKESLRKGLKCKQGDQKGVPEQLKAKNLTLK